MKNTIIRLSVLATCLAASSAAAGPVPGHEPAASVGAQPLPSAEPRPLPLPRVEIQTRPIRNTWFERFQEERRGPEQTERFSRTVRAGRAGALQLSNVSGDIVVTGGGGDEIKIEAVKRARHRDESEAKRQLSSLSIEVMEGGGRVEVRTVYPRWSNRLSVDYTVTVPSGASVDLKSVSGSIRVSNVKGELRAESVSGDVRAGSASRIVAVKSVSGNVEIAQGASDGEIAATSVSGNLMARGLKARNVEAGTVSGDVTLSDVVCERANVRSVSGTLEFAGPLARSGRYELKSHSGDVRLTLAGDTGFELDASTFSGDVRSDLPITLRGAGDREEGRRRHREIRGAFGDASALIVVRTFSGDVVISKR